MHLHVNYQKAEQARALVVIVHGIAEHQGRYNYLTEKLIDAGYDVLRYDQRGHGLSDGKKGKLKSFHDLVDDLHDLVTRYRKEEQKVFLIGHSMGGAVVHLYAIKYGNIDGVISASAASNTPKSAKALKVTGFWYLRWVKISTKMFPDHLSYEPYVKINNINDPLNLKYIYVSLIGEMFIKGARYIHKNIDQINMPILYIHGLDDKIVDVDISRSTYQKIKQKAKKIILYPHAKHELFNERIKDKVINDCIKWLDSR